MAGTDGSIGIAWHICSFSREMRVLADAGRVPVVLVDVKLGEGIWGELERDGSLAFPEAKMSLFVGLPMVPLAAPGWSPA